MLCLTTYLLLCTTILLGPAAVAAQSRTMVSMSGGISIPVAPDTFVDYWGAGYNISGGVGYFLGHQQRFAVQGCVDYSNHPLDEEEFLKAAGVSGISISGGSLQVLAVSVDIRASLGLADARAVPYFLGGVGLFRMSMSDMAAAGGGEFYSQEINESESKIGYGFGAGLDLRLTERSGVFLQAKYSIGLTEDEAMHHLPLKIGFFYR